MQTFCLFVCLFVVIYDCIYKNHMTITAGAKLTGLAILWGRVGEGWGRGMGGVE